MNPPDISLILNLERQVWDAAVRGDPRADARLLHESFLGVYPTGFAGFHEHVSALDAGAIIAAFDLTDARLLVLKPDVVLLAYKASFRHSGAPQGAPPRRMYVSSVWRQFPDGWRNVFSQDTGVDPSQS